MRALEDTGWLIGGPDGAAARLLHVGDERRTVSAGATAILPRNIPQGFRNVASTPSRLVFVIIPGGLEEYFLAVAKCSPPPNPAQLVELGRPFGLTLLPPCA